MPDLPEYYFRVRDNGASVFRVDGDNRQRRLELEQIAFANLRSGEIRAQGSAMLSERDAAAIRKWMEERTVLLARREMEDIGRVVEQLNLTAQWAQSKATSGQVAEVADALLLAMHDLRSVLVRRKAEVVGDREPGK